MCVIDRLSDTCRCALSCPSPVRLGGRCWTSLQGGNRGDVLTRISGGATLWGFERRQRPVRRRSSGLRDRYGSVASQRRAGNVSSRGDCSAANGTFCSTRPRAFVEG